MSSSNNSLIDEYDTSLGYHPSVLPLDIRLGLTKPTNIHTTNDDNNNDDDDESFTTTTHLKWGILGCSKASNDFVHALNFLSSSGLPHAVVAVGSRSADRASSFADLHDIPNVHDSYEELCSDPEINIVYVGTLHPYHKSHAEMALFCGKHVLIEKPICMTSADAIYLYDLSRKLHLFVGEGMWTRFFPVVEWTRCHLGEENLANLTNHNEAESMEQQQRNEDLQMNPIGTVRVITADFSIDGTDVGPYPTDSLFSKDAGGGCSWTTLPYILSAAMMPFDAIMPEGIVAHGILPEDDYHDVDNVGDLAIGLTLTFDNTAIDPTTLTGKKKKKKDDPDAHRVGLERWNAPRKIPEKKSIANGLCGFLAETSERTVYAGKRGRIVIEGPGHCPTEACIVRKSKGRGVGMGNSAAMNDDDDDDSDDASENNHHDNHNHNKPSTRTTNVTFPLPHPTPEMESSDATFQMPNSMGFIYEAEAVRRLIGAGRIFFPQWTPKDSVGCIRIVEEVLRQVKGEEEE